MRIALFHDLPSGGAKRTVHAQVRELVRRGHHVEAYVTTTGEESLFPLRDVADAIHRIYVPPPPDRERMLAGRPGAADLLRWGRLFARLPGAGREAAGRIRRDGCDVALVHPSQFTQAPHLLRFARVPTVYYCHEVLRAVDEPVIAAAPVRAAIRLTLGRVDRRNARSATVIATNSVHTWRRIRARYGRDAVVAPPGVDVHRFRPRSGREDYVLAVGALHPLKGMPFIVEALGRIPAEARPMLVLVSDRARTSEREKVERLASELGVVVRLRERVGEVELAALYSGARAVLAAPHSEPLGLVPLEAMACGTPVVAVAEGGLSETVRDGETGFLVPRDVGRFANRVLYLLEHAAEGEQMGRKGREHVEREWTWERSVDRLVRVLEEAVNE